MAASSSSGSPAHVPGGQAPFRSSFGDTTLTKVFVGGLAWETPSEGLRRHFEQYGEILEAVVITDRLTGRSKGYGFVTFRDPDAARRSVQDPNPMIAGRRANCNIASLGPPRPAPPRGRAPRGPHLADTPAAPMGPPYMPRMLSQMTPHGPVFYPPQYGYWYPPDYPYQQALYNPQMLQHYYPQLYGPTSPSTPPYQYMGYMPGPRAGLPPMHQASRPPFFQQPTAQIEGSFTSMPSLPPNFRLQLPPHAMSRQSNNITDSHSTQPISAAGETNTDNQEA